MDNRTIALHLCVGKWKTPGDSKHKQDDDTHEVKKEIFKRIGKKNFQGKVGSNPDIEITDNGFINLKGVGDGKKKKYYETDISAEDYFILRFTPIPDSIETEIEVLMLDQTLVSSKQSLNIVSHFPKLFKIPKDESLTKKLIERLTEDYQKRRSGITEEFIVLFH